MVLKYLVLVAFIPYISGTSTESSIDTDKESPSNLTLHEIKEKNAHISWDPVPKELMNNCYARYLINIWTEDTNETFLVIPEITYTEIPFFPGEINHVTVSVSSCDSIGPPSNMISFLAPEAEPLRPEFLNLYQLGNNSILVTWYQPIVKVVKLFGFHVFYGDIAQRFSIESAKHLDIFDTTKEQVKISNLKEGSTYRIGVYSLNCAGDSKINYKEIRVEPHISKVPGKPTFTWKINGTESNIKEICPKRKNTNYNFTSELSLEYYLKITTTQKPEMSTLKHNNTKKFHNKHNQNKDRCIVDCKVIWHPNLEENPGDHFYVKFRPKGDREIFSTPEVYDNDFIVIRGFNACRIHEMIVTSVDGEYETESQVQETLALIKF